MFCSFADLSHHSPRSHLLPVLDRYSVEHVHSGVLRKRTVRALSFRITSKCIGIAPALFECAGTCATILSVSPSLSLALFLSNCPIVHLSRRPMLTFPLPNNSKQQQKTCFFYIQMDNKLQQTKNKTKCKSLLLHQKKDNNRSHDRAPSTQNPK